MGPTILILGGDLLARSRVEDATRAVAGRVVPVAVPDLETAVADHRPDLLIVDLDGAGRDALDEIARLRATVPGFPRAVGYYSHVDEALGAAARDAGCEAVPRGRFWRTLPELLARD